MSIRLFHRGARLVLVVRRRAPGDEIWWSPHWAAPDWQPIFAQQLRLLGVASELAGPLPCLLTPLGQIQWQAGRRWSIMSLQLGAGSDTKRRLVAAALLRAARYARPAW